MGTGVKSSGQMHGMDEFHATGTSSLAVTESKCGYDVRGRNANSQVLVHVVRNCNCANVVDLEMLELSSDTPRHKSFVPDV